MGEQEALDREEAEGVATKEAVETAVKDSDKVGVGVTADEIEAKMGVIVKPREGEFEREEDTVALTVPPHALAVSNPLRVTKFEALIN